MSPRPTHRLQGALPLALLLSLPGCPDGALWGHDLTFTARDPDLEPPRVVAISLGEIGAAEPPQGVPLSVLIEVTLSEPIDPQSAEGDAIVLRDAAGAAIPLDLDLEGAALRLEPTVVLAPRAEHTLVLSGTLRDLHGAPLSDERGLAGPFEYTFVTGDETAGPPRATLVTPPEGAADVPRNIAEVVVGFTEPVFGRVRLGSWTGSCDGSDRCAIALDAPLEPAREYTVDASGARDEEGLAAVGAPAFRAGQELDEQAPALGPTPCTPAELPLGPSCVSARDVTIAVRLVTGETALAFVEAEGRRTQSAEPGTLSRVVVVGLSPDRDIVLVVGATDAAGNVAQAEGLAVRTLPPLAPVIVTEVYADAAGTEPAQEFVEILNLGRADVSLEGFVIADGGGPGGAIGAGAVLGPGQYGLVVPDRFDPTSALDPPVAPAAPLFRVGSSLGTNGLLNAGEPVMLLDPAGHELSRYPALLSPRAGVSAQRVSPEVDEADVDGWREDREVGATGGTANSVGP